MLPPESSATIGPRNIPGCSTSAATAAAPAGYQARFIGRSARERARLQHVAGLEQQLDQAQGQLLLLLDWWPWQGVLERYRG